MKEESNMINTEITEKENLLSIITNIYKSVIKKYNDIFNQEGYLPTKKAQSSIVINGFTERNLTFNFCHSYLNLSKPNPDAPDAPNAIVWQEVPFKNVKRQHIDSIIIDKDNNWVIYIEAKRLYDIAHFEFLLDDLKRIKDRHSDIPLPLKHPTNKAIVLLADHYYHGICDGKKYKDDYYDPFFTEEKIKALPEIVEKYPTLANNLAEKIKTAEIRRVCNDVPTISICGENIYNINIKDEIIYSIYCGVYFID